MRRHCPPVLYYEGDPENFEAINNNVAPFIKLASLTFLAANVRHVIPAPQFTALCNLLPSLSHLTRLALSITLPVGKNQGQYLTFPRAAPWRLSRTLHWQTLSSALARQPAGYERWSLGPGSAGWRYMVRRWACASSFTSYRLLVFQWASRPFPYESMTARVNPFRT
jgi:hypothetical protein